MSDVRRVRRRLGDVVGGAASEEERPQEGRRRRMKPLERRRRARRKGAAERSLRVLMRGRSRLGDDVPGRRGGGRGAKSGVFGYSEVMDVVISEGAFLLRDALRARSWVAVKELGPKLGGSGKRMMRIVTSTVGGQQVKRKLRMEPYNPSAEDGDGDGIVQEGTPWERPKGTFIRDKSGKLLEAGAKFDLSELDSGKRKLTDFTVVREDGSRYSPGEGEPGLSVFGEIEDTEDNREALGKPIQSGKQKSNPVDEKTRKYPKARRDELKKLFGDYKSKKKSSDSIGEAKEKENQKVEELLAEGKITQEEYDERQKMVAFIGGYNDVISGLTKPAGFTEEEAEDYRQRVAMRLIRGWYNFQDDPKFYGDLKEGEDPDQPKIDKPSVDEGYRAIINSVARSIRNTMYEEKKKQDKVGGAQGDVAETGAGRRPGMREFDENDPEYWESILEESGEDGEDGEDGGSAAEGELTGIADRGAEGGGVFSEVTDAAEQDLKDGIDLTDAKAVVKSRAAQKYVEFMETLGSGFKEMWDDDASWHKVKTLSPEESKALADHYRQIFLWQQVFGNPAVSEKLEKRKVQLKDIIEALQAKDKEKYANNNSDYNLSIGTITGRTNRMFGNNIWPLVAKNLLKMGKPGSDPEQTEALAEALAEKVRKSKLKKEPFLAFLAEEVGFDLEQIQDIDSKIRLAGLKFTGTRKTLEQISSSLRVKRLAQQSEYWNDWLRVKASVAKRAVRTGKKKLKRPPITDEPYNPDAEDGDGDGIVQEGTIWERPAKTFVFDADGNPFAAGADGALEYGSISIRDANGNPMKYVRTWEAPRKKGKDKLGRAIGARVRTPTLPTGDRNEGTRFPKPRDPNKPPPKNPKPMRLPTDELDLVDDAIRRNWDALPEEQRAIIEGIAEAQRLDRDDVKERLLILLEVAKKDPEMRAKGLSWYGEVRRDIEERAKRLEVSPEAFAAVLGATSPRMKWESDNPDLLPDDPARFPNHAAAEQVILTWNDNPELEITEEFAKAWFEAGRGSIDIREFVGQKRPLQDWSPDIASRLMQYYGLGQIEGVGVVMTERISSSLQALHAEKRGMDPGMVLNGNKTYAFYKALLDDDYHNAVIDVWMIQAASGRAVSNPDDKEFKVPVKNPPIGYIAHGALDEGRPGILLQRKGFNPQGALYHWIADVVNEIAKEQDPPMKISDVQALIWYAIRTEGLALLPDRLRENPATQASDGLFEDTPSD